MAEPLAPVPEPLATMPGQSPSPAPGAPATQGPTLPLRTWLRQGLRAGFFLRPRIAGEQPRPAQLIVITLGLALLDLALARLEVWGDAEFNLRGWLAPWWGTGASALLAWWALPASQAQAQQPRGLAAWLALWLVALLPANLLDQGLSLLRSSGPLPAWMSGDWESWGLFLLPQAWGLAVALRLMAHFGAAVARRTVLAVGLVAILAVSIWQFPDRAWLPVAGDDAVPPAQLELSQELFETQQAVWEEAVKAIEPSRHGVVNVYGLVFAPYAEEDVFLRESNLVADLLAQRFDAAGRVLQLVNHAATGDTLAWATPQNLERAIEALAQRMDRERDVLVIYLTSHGGGDHRLEASNPPLLVDSVSPAQLRHALDNAGVRHRVVAVSACFSGGWIGPLEDEHTLVMTAADATHTSYGCGRRSQLTFFGRAVFDEQLRKTHSFEQAFAAAVPLIKLRELQAGKDDGFSNPQISVGEKIRPVLRELEQRLDRASP